MDFNNLAFLVGSLLGLVLKRKPTFVNKFIPYAILTLQFVVRMGQAIVEGVVPAVGVGPVEFQTASVFGGIFGGLGAVLAIALKDTLVAVALHSIGKNTLQGIRQPPK